MIIISLSVPAFGVVVRHLAKLRNNSVRWEIGLVGLTTLTDSSLIYPLLLEVERLEKVNLIAGCPKEAL